MEAPVSQTTCFYQLVFSTQSQKHSKWASSRKSVQCYYRTLSFSTIIVGTLKQSITRNSKSHAALGELLWSKLRVLQSQAKVLRLWCLSQVISMCKGTLMNLEMFLIQLLTVCWAEILQNLYYLYNLKKTSFKIRSLTFSSQYSRRWLKSPKPGCLIHFLVLFW